MPPNRPASRRWTDVQMAIAAIAMTSVLAFWNMFAGPDREKAAQKEAAQQQALITPNNVVMSAPIVVPTVPPVGFTLLVGGAAPHPKVIHSGGNGGNGNGAAVTSTKSS